MPSSKTQGTSFRTGFKHFLLDQLVGAICGVVCNGTQDDYVGIKSIMFIDACAGTGEPTPDSEKSSPSIMLNHARYCASPARFYKTGNRVGKVMKHQLYSYVRLIEKVPEQFNRLIETQAPDAQPVGDPDDRAFQVRDAELPYLHVHLRNCDASDYKFANPNLPDDLTCLLHIDPNVVSDIPRPEVWTQWLTPVSFAFMTLGCNPAGRKRGADIEERRGWYDYVQALVDSATMRHDRFDLIFVSLENDSHQWAYLFSLPKKWTDRFMKIIEKPGNRILRTAIHEGGHTRYRNIVAKAISYKSGRNAFLESVDQHFLTRKELEARA